MQVLFIAQLFRSLLNQFSVSDDQTVAWFKKTFLCFGKQVFIYLELLLLQRDGRHKNDFRKKSVKKLAEKIWLTFC